MTTTSSNTTVEPTILVTGSKGFIGATLLRKRGLAPGMRFVGVDREEVDLCEECAVRDLLERYRPSRVVHLAGALIKGDDASVFEKQWHNTFLAGINLLKAAVHLGIRHVIIPGSIDELGNQPGVLAPNATTQPRSTYGLCKCLLREYAAYWVRRSTLRVDWFRPFVVYGPGQLRGQMLLPIAFRAARLGQQAAFSDGLQERDFIHVEDVVDWILRAVAVRLPETGGQLKIHHLGTGKGIKVRKVLQKIADEFPNARFDIGGIPRRPGEPMLEISAPYQSDEPPLSAWQPQYGWEDGIAQTCAWWRSIELAD